MYTLKQKTKRYPTHPENRTPAHCFRWTALIDCDDFALHANGPGEQMMRTQNDDSLKSKLCRFSYINCLRRDVRRPALFAFAIFVVVDLILPGRSHLQTITITSAQNQLVSEHQFDVASPQFEALKRQVARTDNSKRVVSDRYIRSKWEMELAAVYANDSRTAEAIDRTDTPTPASNFASSKIAQVSFVTSTSSVNATTKVSQSTSLGGSDYWTTLLNRSRKEVEQHKGTSVQRLPNYHIELGQISYGPRSTVWFSIQFAMATLAFLLFKKWYRAGLTFPTFIVKRFRKFEDRSVKRIGLSCQTLITLPAGHFTVRQSIRERLSGLHFIALYEAGLIAFCAAYLLFLA